jgi:UDP-N-acetylglucosamine diphosphorylase/glucosamine-1-phosphate N-acetyltransferase
MILAGVYDLVTALEHFLPGDVADFTQEGGEAIPEGSVVLGDPHDVVLLGASIEPGVTFDVRRGPVVVEQHAYVFGGSRLQGPVYVGPGTQILGGLIENASIGPRCKLRGEISGSVFLGFANKAHDGFLGHSVIGRWVNLGAGTTTSNLKNTYGLVRLDHPEGRIETERQFLGSLIGDHAKTAVGTMLATGTMIGTGANVFGGPPKRFIPSFAWGVDGDRMRKDGFIATAEKVLLRRNVEMTDEIRAMLEAIHDHGAR